MYYTHTYSEVCFSRRSDRVYGHSGPFVYKHQYLTLLTYPFRVLVVMPKSHFPPYFRALLHISERRSIPTKAHDDLDTVAQGRYIPDLYDLYGLAHAAGWEPFTT